MQLGLQRGGTGYVVRRICAREHPEDAGRDGHAGGIDLRHEGPGTGVGDQRRGDELGHGRAGVAGTEDAHGQPLAILREPARHIGRAYREGTTGQTDEQRQHQELPVFGGIGHQPDGGHGAKHQHEQHDAATEAVGPDAQRHPHQRPGQHRHGRQQAKLGFVQPQLLLDGDAQHGKHHPRGKTDGECKGTGGQHRIGAGGNGTVLDLVDHDRNSLFSFL